MTYPIPVHVPPLTDELVCFCVYAPNDPEYINILSGAIHGLGLWINYDRTTDKAGVLAAHVWQGINGQMSICGTVTIEFRQEPGCMLEFRQDGGTWQSIYDPSACIPEPPDLSDYLIRHPLTNGRNLITTNGNAAFMIDTSNTLFSANHVLRGGQMLYSSYPGQDIDGERYRPIFNLQRPSEHSAAPLVIASVIDTASDVYTLNGWAETGTRRYPSFADVSTPDVTHSGALILVHDNTYDRDDLYISELQSDASFHWRKWFTQQDAIAVLGDVWGAIDTAYEELPPGSTPEITFEPVTPTVNPPRTLVTLKTPPFGTSPVDGCPDIEPPADLETKHYTMTIDAKGTMLPFSVPANVTMENFTARGLWNIHSVYTASIVDMPVGGHGDPSHVADFQARGQVLLNWQPDDGSSHQWPVTPDNPYSGRTSVSDEFWQLFGNDNPLSDGNISNEIIGQLCVEFDLIRGDVAGWVIEFDMHFQPADDMALTGSTGANTPYYDAVLGAGGTCVYSYYAVLTALCDSSTRITRADTRMRGKANNGFLQCNAGVGGIGATSIGTVSATEDIFGEVGAAIDYSPGSGIHDLFLNFSLLGTVDDCSGGGDPYHVWSTKWRMSGTGTRPVFT